MIDSRDITIHDNRCVCIAVSDCDAAYALIQKMIAAGIVEDVNDEYEES